MFIRSVYPERAGVILRPARPAALVGQASASVGAASQVVSRPWSSNDSNGVIRSEADGRSGARDQSERLPDMIFVDSARIHLLVHVCSDPRSHPATALARDKL